MADYATLASKLVLDAIKNKIPGLNITVDFHYWLSDGVYDEVADALVPEYTAIEDVVCVKAKPTAKDTADYGVQWNETKLIVPGLLVPQEPNPDADFVMIAGIKHGISKVVGTPGNPVWLIFVKRT